MNKFTTPYRAAAFVLACLGISQAQVCSSQYTIVGTSKLHMADRTNAQGSFWGATFSIGNDANLSGILTAPTSLALGDRTKFTGDAHWNGAYLTGNNVQLSGTTTQDASVLDCVVPVVPASITGAAVTVPNDSGLTLLPGTYGDVLVRARSVLRLRDGAYNFSTFTLESDTRLSWDGSPNIQIAGSASIGDRVQAVGSGSLQAVIGSNLTIGTNDWITGEWDAPAGDVHVFSRTLIQGSLLGKNVNLESDIIINNKQTMNVTIFDSVLVAFSGSLTWPEFLQGEFRMYHATNDDSAQPYSLDVRERRIMDATQPSTEGTRVPLLTIMDTLQLYGNGNYLAKPVQLAALAVETTLDSVIGIHIPWNLQRMRGAYVASCQLTISGQTYMVYPMSITWIKLPQDGVVHATLNVTTSTGSTWSNGFDFNVKARTQGGQP